MPLPEVCLEAMERVVAVSNKPRGPLTASDRRQSLHGPQSLRGRGREECSTSPSKSARASHDPEPLGSRSLIAQDLGKVSNSGIQVHVVQGWHSSKFLPQ